MTREEAISILEMLRFPEPWEQKLSKGAEEALDMAISALSENKGEWIPIAERIPEMGIYVLCACQANIYDVLKLTPEGWFHDVKHTYMLGFVKAWKPLPEPYKEGGE